MREWIESAKDAERGELLAAVDIAEPGLGEHSRTSCGSSTVGARPRARRRDRRRRRSASSATASLPSQEEDIAALRRADRQGPRARRRSGAERDARRPGARATCTKRSTRAPAGYYPAINAATLEPGRRRAGARPRRSRERCSSCFARRGDCPTTRPRPKAEAHLLLGDEAPARAALERAAAAARRRLRGARDDAPPAAPRLRARRHRRPDVLAPARRARPSCTSAATGSRADGSLPDDGGAASRRPDRRRGRPLATRVRLRRARERRGHPLGGGAARARRRVARRAAVRARRSSSRAPSLPAGEGWVARFHRCLRRREDRRPTRPTTRSSATTCSTATAPSWRWAWRCCAARYLDAEVRQLAVWDGGPASGEAGTAIDVATWRAAGGRSTDRRAGSAAARRPARRRATSLGRAVRPRRPVAAVRRRQRLLQAHRRAAAAVRRARARDVRGGARRLRRARSSTETPGVTRSTWS